jgi:hypothetical protein
LCNKIITADKKDPDDLLSWLVQVPPPKTLSFYSNASHRAFAA